MKKLLLSFVLVVALAVAAAAFVFLRRVPAVAPPTEPLVVANVGLYSILNHVALERGIFARHGLDVTVNEYDSGGTSMAALLAGDADVAIAADFVGVRNMFERTDLLTLGQVSSHQTFRVIARRDAGIARPADLAGKRIGVTRRTAGEFYLGRFLLFSGLREADVTVSDLSPADMISGLETGTLDAIVIFEPHAYALEERMGARVVAWSAQGEQRALGLAYVTRGFVERRPDVAKRYIAALVEAEGYVAADPQGARAIVGTALSLDSRYLEFVWPRFEFAVRIPQGMIIEMEDQSRWMMAHGMSTATGVPNYLDRIWFDALLAADPASVGVVH